MGEVSHLLDTNVLVEWFRDGPAQQYVEDLLEQPGTILGVSWVSVAEYLVKAQSHESHALVQALSANDLVFYDASGLDLARAASEARRETSLPLPDSIILATAKRHGLVLVTRDAELAKKGAKYHRHIKWVK